MPLPIHAGHQHYLKEHIVRLTGRLKRLGGTRIRPELCGKIDIVQFYLPSVQ